MCFLGSVTKCTTENVTYQAHLRNISYFTNSFLFLYKSQLSLMLESWADNSSQFLMLFMSNKSRFFISIIEPSGLWRYNWPMEILPSQTLHSSYIISPSLLMSFSAVIMLSHCKQKPILLIYFTFTLLLCLPWICYICAYKTEVWERNTWKEM